MITVDNHHHQSTDEQSTVSRLQLARSWAVRTIPSSEKCLLESVHSWTWLETDIITVSIRSSSAQCCQVLNLDMTPSHPRSGWNYYMCCSRLFVTTVHNGSLCRVFLFIFQSAIGEWSISVLRLLTLSISQSCFLSERRLLRVPSR